MQNKDREAHNPSAIKLTKDGMEITSKAIHFVSTPSPTGTPCSIEEDSITFYATSSDDKGA